MCVKSAAQLRQVFPHGHLKSRGLMAMARSQSRGFYLSMNQQIIKNGKLVISCHNHYKLPNWLQACTGSRKQKGGKSMGSQLPHWGNKTEVDNNMLANNNSEEECFLEAEGEQPTQEEELRLDLPKRIREHLPANELRTVRRPDNMAPRTFFLDSPRTLLLDAINLPCQEVAEGGSEQGRLKLRILNSKNLSIEEYFSRERFRCLYNKLEGAKTDNCTFLGRLKGIDSLVDYNWKNFRELPPPQTPQPPPTDKIDADFESGNVCRAYMGAEQREYYLLVQNDVNTYGYNNWFFFRCVNAGAGVRRFTVVNLAKKTSFFGQGMLISVFSRRRWEQEGLGWFKGGERLTFGTINFLRTHHDNEYYSSLAFQYNFKEEADQVFFAISQPYTYSRLVRFLQDVSEQRRSYVEVKNIGYSIANNIIPTLRISQNPNAQEVILVIARQHPCETTGSFIAEYLIRHLLEQASEIVRHLLSQFQFVIVPMVNPDGVIHGMSRCNMSGLDLNRHWGEDTLKELTPQVMKVKQLIASVSKTKRIKFMLDLHGHGKKLSSFFFCCGNEKEHYRLLSLSMRKMERRFSLAQCTYGISRDKQNTIRSKINSMGIGHSYTLETSLYGWRNPQGEVLHFNQYDYSQIAQSLLKSIFLIEAPQSLALTLLGITREVLLSEAGSFNQTVDRDDKAVAENNELLSESDPQGDRLDVKDLLCKCENKTLKKRLEELQRKKLKKQKGARNLAKLTGRHSSKNMRESCPTGFYPTKFSGGLHQSALGREVLVKLQAKSNNAKKVSFSEKWEVRRREIVQRQEKLKSQTAQRELAEGSANTATKPRRNRIKSEVSTFVDRRIGPIAPSLPAKHTLKKKPLSHKMKTEFKEVEELGLLSQEEIRQSQSRKSALQLRFKQLKQESLNVILTDTLSISKILPTEKDKEKGEKLQHRSIKNIALRPKSEYMATQPAAKFSLKVEEQECFEETLRYKKFKQFLTSGHSPSKKTEKSVNSVFYYFPVL